MTVTPGSADFIIGLNTLNSRAEYVHIKSDVNVPVFDTTRIHAESAVEYALGNQSTLS